MNKVTLIGRLTKDLELRKVQSGSSVVSFTLAVNRRFKQEGQPDADFIRCTAWGKTAEVMAQYLVKGSQIGVEGRIQTGQYQDKNGATVFTTDVVVENFDFLSTKSQNSGSTTMQTPPNPQGFNDFSDGGSTDFPEGTLDIASDDLPF